MKALNPSKLKLMIYTGPSMNPTLRAGDMLQVAPYDNRKIRRGDVIVFNSPENEQKITHRIVFYDSRRIRTRGDNNRSNDPWILGPDNIIGRVVYTQKRNKRKKVFGGPAGQLFSIAVRLTKVLDLGISLLLRPAYRWMVRTGFFRRLFNNQIKQRVICLKRSEGPELQLIMGRHVVGRFLPGKTQWHLRRPFRLIVDEETLPTNGLRDK